MPDFFDQSDAMNILYAQHLAYFLAPKWDAYLQKRDSELPPEPTNNTPKAGLVLKLADIEPQTPRRRTA